MEISSVLGLVIAGMSIAVGQWLGGGSLLQLIQFPAMVIVFGGTAAASVASIPGSDLFAALKILPTAFFKSGADSDRLIEEIVKTAGVARKDGILAIESLRPLLKDAVFKRWIKYVAEGFETGTLKEILSTEMSKITEANQRAVEFLESAASYAPTIGVLGAVLGLIQVMGRLNDPSQIGSGISTAFVATFYGIGLSNLLLLPWAALLKRRLEKNKQGVEIASLGVLGIQEGMSPSFLEEKLRSLGRAE